MRFGDSVSGGGGAGADDRPGATGCRAGCSLTVDATGVETLRAARMGCEIRPVTITGGERAHVHSYGWSVPKQDLIAGLRALAEQVELRISRDLRGLRTLMRELLVMQA